jgi:phosphohistidine phosphatase
VNLYLIRHADALPVSSPNVADDAARPLSPEGLAQTAALAAWFKALGVHFDKVVTSPLIRALQTGEHLVRSMPLPAPELVQIRALAPGQPSKKLAKFLCGLEANHLALIGHEPDLSRHAAWLIGTKKTRMALAKAGAARIECDEPPQKGAGILVWLVTPQAIAARAASS